TVVVGAVMLAIAVVASDMIAIGAPVSSWLHDQCSMVPSVSWLAEPSRMKLDSMTTCSVPSIATTGTLLVWYSVTIFVSVDSPPQPVVSSTGSSSAKAGQANVFPFMG